jgi:hypothetical protein
VRERVVAIGVEREEPPVEQHVDRLPSSAFDHELRARLAEGRRCVVDKTPGVSLYAQVDAALRLSRRGTLLEPKVRSARAFRR